MRSKEDCIRIRTIMKKMRDLQRTNKLIKMDQRESLIKEGAEKLNSAKILTILLGTGKGISRLLSYHTIRVSTSLTTLMSG